MERGRDGWGEREGRREGGKERGKGREGDGGTEFFKLLFLLLIVIIRS